jgi:hypothetical protein
MNDKVNHSGSGAIILYQAVGDIDDKFIEDLDEQGYTGRYLRPEGTFPLSGSKAGTFF